MMSNPELMKMASESMKNMRPEDFKLAAEQLKHTRPEQMAEIGEKMANATPEEIAAVCGHAYALMKYEISEAEMLKKKANELHSQGRFHEAMQKYCLAKQNLREIPSSEGRKLLLSCTLSLMSCYLKTGQYDECVKEGSEVLAYDAKNLKALFRRGQAYKELRLLKDAVSDLSMACEVCPGDDTVSKLLRETKEMLAEDSGKHAPKECMRNMRLEDFKLAAELKHTRPEQMAEIGEEMENATPEAVATMFALVDARMKNEISGVEMLKKQGNELHKQRRFHEAMQKYCLAKENLREIPSSQSRKLLVVCSLNLMSCYLKTGQYDKCVREGSEVLAYDAKNIKALYRRGQAYKELGLLKDVVSDLSMACEVCPGDDTVSKLLRETKEMLAEDGGKHAPRGLVFEEITEEDQNVSTQNFGSSSIEQTVAKPKILNTSSKSSSTVINDNLKSNMEGLNALEDDPKAIRQSKDMSPDMIRIASNMNSKMSALEHQKMLDMASSHQGDNPFLRGSPNSTINSGSIPPNVTPDMFKTASDMTSKMPPLDLQKTFEMASSMSGKASGSSSATVDENVRNASQLNFPASNAFGRNAFAESSSCHDLLSNMRNAAQSNFPSSSTDLQEQMRNQMKDPAMRQMFTSMITNMSPDMMANMEEQFDVKLSKEDAAKAQQAMSFFLPEDLDRMMRWVDQVQRGVEGAKKTKNWLLGKPGLIMAIVMLILALILRLGFIGG